MTWVGWVALAAAIGVWSLPSAASVRTAALAGRGRLPQRGVPGRASRLRAIPLSWPLASTAGGCVVLAALRFGPLIAIAVTALLAAAALLAGDLVRRRRGDARRRDLASAVRVLVGELEAGSQPGTALAAAAAAGPGLAEPLTAAAGLARVGGDAGSVLADDADLRAVGVAWRLGDATGSALAEVLGRVAADLTTHDHQRRTVATALAGPRSSAALLSGLPALGIALGAAMGARPLPFLTGAPAGRALCCIGVLLDVAGLLWMRRIVRRAERS